MFTRLVGSSANDDDRRSVAVHVAPGVCAWRRENPRRACRRRPNPLSPNIENRRFGPWHRDPRGNGWQTWNGRVLTPRQTVCKHQLRRGRPCSSSAPRTPCILSSDRHHTHSAVPCPFSQLFSSSTGLVLVSTSRPLVLKRYMSCSRAALTSYMVVHC